MDEEEEEEEEEEPEAEAADEAVDEEVCGSRPLHDTYVPALLLEDGRRSEGRAGWCASKEGKRKASTVAHTKSPPRVCRPSQTSSVMVEAGTLIEMEQVKRMMRRTRAAKKGK